MRRGSHSPPTAIGTCSKIYTSTFIAVTEHAPMEVGGRLMTLRPTAGAAGAVGQVRLAVGGRGPPLVAPAVRGSRRRQAEIEAHPLPGPLDLVWGSVALSLHT